jgi:hypothetical protein
VSLDGSEKWIAKAQHDLEGEDVTVTMSDGSVVRGTIDRLDADTLYLKGEHDGEVSTEPLHGVVLIRPGRKVAPAIAGMLGGALLGGIVGGAIAMEAEEPDPRALGFNTAFAGIGGAAAGALVGLAVGGVVVSLATAVTDYNVSPGRAETAGVEDIVTILDARILRETDLSITIPWYAKTTTLPKSRISMQKKAGEIQLRVPRSLLYDGDSPKYIDDAR